MTELKIDLNKIDHLSWTQIYAFYRNPIEWFYPYQIEKKLKEQLRTRALDAGIAYHEAMEALYTGSDLTGALQIFDEIIRKYQHEAIDRWIGKDDKASQIQEEILRLREGIQYYAEWILPAYQPYVKPENVELMVKDFRIDGVDVPIYMKIDVLTDDGRIIDHKTVGYMDVNAEMHGQLLLYAAWYYRKFGVLPRAGELHRVYKQKPRSRRNTVDISSVQFNLADILNIEKFVRAVWHMMKESLLFWSPSVKPYGKAKMKLLDRYREDLILNMNK